MSANGLLQRRSKMAVPVSCVGVLVGAVLISMTCPRGAHCVHSSIVRQVSSPEDLNHLTVDSSGTVYLGAVNVLYRLSSNLQYLQNVSTGPVWDNKFCTFPFTGREEGTCGGSKRKKITKNYNKILLVIQRDRKLLTCGSVQQGICQMRDLNNLTNSQSYMKTRDQYVAANDERSSTVGFIGSGSDGNQVLYTGITVSGDLIRPAISVASRIIRNNPDKLLRFTFKDPFEDRGSFLTVKANMAATYKVHYIAGFSVGNFNYFLTVQKKMNGDTVTNEYISKISQICGQDPQFSSYVEMPLECQGGNKNYNILKGAAIGTPGRVLASQMGMSATDKVLVATFSEGSGPNNVQNTSGVCLYSFKDIRQKFTQNIRTCYQAQGGIIKYLSTEAMSCNVDSRVTITENFCGADPKLNTPIEGNMSLYSNPVLTYNDVNITAVAMAVIEEHTVAFLGTYTGHLKKIVLQRDGMGAREYSDITVDDRHPILPDMHFDPAKSHIYVMTRNKAFKIRVSECEKYTECNQCIVSTDDPYCGWCSLQRSCIHKKSCPNSNMNDFWLSPKSWGCIRISHITPDRASVSRQEKVTLTIDQLPTGTDRNYVCMFGDIETAAESVVKMVVQCSTPPKPHIPLVRNGYDHINVTLAVKSVETNMSFVQTTFTFYDCSHHKSCTECTMAKWGCSWCVHSNGCVSTTDRCPHTADEGFSDRQMCPQLKPVQADIRIPVGVRWEIELRATNLPEPLPGEAGYTCIIHHQTPPINVTARRINDRTIVCDGTVYDYMTRKKKETGKIDVIWNRSFYIDDVNDVQAQFYKCDLMGEDCSLCISLVDTEPEYQCRWCGDICKYTPPSSRDCKATSKLSNCPQPQLTGVNPLTGPLGGGTKVTISGSNLGTNFKQIKDGILIAGRRCIPIERLYETARKIVCTTVAVPSPLSGPVVVKIGQANATFESFQYQDPVLEGLSPTIGPMAGGTEVTISGQNLNTGADIRVSLDSLPCTLHKEVSATKITCRTRGVNRPRTTNSVRVLFDGNQELKRVVYNYTLNPNITNITPRDSYRSGGRVLTVEGTFLDVIQKPRFFIKSGEVRSPMTECTKVNDTLMKCPVPDVRDFLKISRRRREVPKYEMGFKMDDVKEVTNMGKEMPWVDAMVSLYPDPVIMNFTDFHEIYTGGALVLEGTGLTRATTQSEVMVMIGDEYCKIETLSDTKLVCDPPYEQPPGLDENGQKVTTKLPEVKVIINSGFTQVVGTLEYQASTSKLYFPPIAIAGIVAGGSILVIIIIIILIIYRRKSTEADRQYKKMQVQLDTLESNVRNECKQAFAELQTEVTDLTSDLNMTGIPFWDYKTYTFKVLFPSHTDHPVLHSKLDGIDTKHGGYEQGLQQFNQLLNSKQFLIIFIRTLESQKNFSIRDKAIVASLLMIVLQDKMEYATEILKALLNELIDKSVEKKHPKLMLRRTESVVEKFLTNWLSICMYTYLKKHAGKSMFMLYKAIKHQTEKGPVDAITSEARYSLSEDRLLREKIEPKTLLINLVVENEDEMVTCKVLDCDTITQAKEKALDAIYMNTPCSRRPSIHDVDLEWRSGRSGHLPLQDEDVTTQMIHGWKRINTLAHYHVPDGAIMSLSPSRNKNDMIRTVHADHPLGQVRQWLNNVSSWCNRHSGMVEITSGSPLSAMTPIVTVEEGHKVWHLVKHDDSQNQSRTQKVISEIFLTRLLSTKGTLQQFIDDLFLMILKVDNSVPPAIKYLFDFLDQAARRHNILDPEVVHTWKSNSLPLRFWVNLIKNPEFVFDIRKSHIVDSCLSVIAQTFMDSCSTTEHRLGKDSPSNKLLFARDIPKYRKWVEKFYKEVQEMPPVRDQEMNAAMTELSMMLSVSEQEVNLLMSDDIPMRYVVDFNVSCALKELYKYATQYNIELLEALDDDPSARKLHLSHKFEQVSAHIEGTPLY